MSSRVLLVSSESPPSNRAHINKGVWSAKRETAKASDVVGPTEGHAGIGPCVSPLTRLVLDVPTLEVIDNAIPEIARTRECGQ